MKKIAKILTCLIVLFSIKGCYEDKGDYDHVAYRIESIDSYSRENVSNVVLGDSVKIHPVIEWSNSGIDSLEFEYFYVFDGDTISRERYLHLLPSQVGHFSGYFIVRDKVTKLMNFTYVSYTVSSPFKCGWLILSEKDGKTVLSMLAQTSKYYTVPTTSPDYVAYENGDITPEGVYENKNFRSWKDYVDVYGQLNGEALGSDPISVDIGIVGYSSDYSEVIVLQKNGGNWVLNGNTFAKYYDFTADFGSGVAKDFKPVEFIDVLTSHYMIGEDGTYYWRKIAPSTKDSRQCAWENLLYFGNNAKVTKKFDGWHYKLGAILVYDEMNNAIIPITSEGQNSEASAGRLLNITYNAEVPENFVRLDDMGEYTPILVANTAGSGDYNSSNLYMILKKGDKLYAQRCQAVMNSYNGKLTISNMGEIHEFPADGKVNENSIYLKCKKDNDYLFVAEGSKLYFYETNIPQRGLRLFKDFGSKIVHLTENGASWSLGVSLENGEFHMLGTYDRFFMQENLGDQATYHVTKNLGKIVEAIWKPGNYANWMFGFNY